MVRPDRSKLLLVAGCAAFLAAACQSIATAQPAATSPPAAASTFKNLRVLPQDIARPQLSMVMKDYSAALGVRCSHCHVGEEGKPLSTYDFASDAKQQKLVARGMIRMVHRINQQDFGASPDSKVKVTCYTCHRGETTPLTAPPPAS